MLLIRRFEERVLELFKAGVLFGTTHTYIGQEATAVSVMNRLGDSDLVISNHRCHGHYITRTGDITGLLAEIMGKEGGPCLGRGGSQHLCKDGFFTNGVLGNMFPTAAGMAYGEKLKGHGNIAVAFIGDGTFGQGVIYETMNLISLWNVPLLTVVENNRYAQSTPLKNNFSGNFTTRVNGFDISVGEVESNDVEELYNKFHDIVGEVRSTGMPHVEVIHTYRLGPHSTTEYGRSKEEIAAWKEKDPLKIIKKRLDKDKISAIEKIVKEKLEDAERIVKGFSLATLENNT